MKNIPKEYKTMIKNRLKENPLPVYYTNGKKIEYYVCRARIIYDKMTGEACGCSINIRTLHDAYEIFIENEKVKIFGPHDRLPIPNRLLQRPLLENYLNDYESPPLNWKPFLWPAAMIAGMILPWWMTLFVLMFSFSFYKMVNDK